MRMHKIEIDQDVFNYLKSQAEPFVDTPNDVLRRLLPLKTTGEKNSLSKTIRAPGYNLPPTPAGTPKALEHILQVVYLTQYFGVSRPDATKYVAKIHGGIAPQTVLDKYCRQLNLKASEFDKLIAEPELVDLKKTLFTKFKGHSDVIEEYLTLH